MPQHLLRDFPPEGQQRISASFCRNVLVLDDCWSWRGTIDDGGYTRLGVNLQARGGPKTNLRGHRVAYELFCRPLGRDQVVMHICDNRECTNPLHLVAGTLSDNARDAYGKGRMHEFLPRLDQSLVLEIRFEAKLLLAKGNSSYAVSQTLAEDYNISSSTVYRIITGRHSLAPSHSL